MAASLLVISTAAVGCMSQLHEVVRQRFTEMSRGDVAGKCHWDVTGSRPFFVMAGTAAGDDRNWMSTLAASVSLAPTPTRSLWILLLFSLIWSAIPRRGNISVER